MITAGLSESMIAAIPDRSLPSTSNDARPPSGRPRMWSSHAEPVGRALRFLGARRSQLRSSRDVGEIANALGAVGGDHEMGLASFSREPRQQRADDAFVIGVSEDGEDGPATLSLRRERDDRGQRHSDESMCGNSHAIHCTFAGRRARPHTRCRRRNSPHA